MPKVNYHSLIVWSFINDDETHVSSFCIERDAKASYAMTKIQLNNKFQEAMKEEFGERVLIKSCTMRTMGRVIHM